MSEATVRFYESNASIVTSNTSQMAQGIEQAAADGVDVLNNSWQFHGVANSCANNCSNTFDASGIRAEIEAAELAGVVVVAAAGNSHNDGCNQTCDVVFPAYVPDVISVTALADTNGSNYRAVNLADFASRGSKQVTRVDGSIGHFNMVDMAAFGFVRTPFDVTSSVSYLPLDFGTSFAAPQVASLAGAFRQWMEDVGIGFASTSWAVGVNTLLMGDGYQCAGCSAVYGIDAGYGFPKYFTPIGAHIGGGGGWGTRTFNIVQGQTVAWTVGDAGPEGNDVVGWKWAMVVDPSSASNFPNLNVRVVDTCNGNQVIANSNVGSPVFRYGILSPMRSLLSEVGAFKCVSLASRSKRAAKRSGRQTSSLRTLLLITSSLSGCADSGPEGPVIDDCEVVGDTGCSEGCEPIVSSSDSAAIPCARDGVFFGCAPEAGSSFWGGVTNLAEGHCDVAVADAPNLVYYCFEGQRALYWFNKHADLFCSRTPCTGELIDECKD